MYSKKNIAKWVEEIKETTQPSLIVKDAAIANEIEKSEQQQSIAIKILSILGGLFASFLFLGFLFIIGAYDSQAITTMLGIMGIGSSFLLSNFVKSKLIDTVCIFLYCIGLTLLAISFAMSEFEIVSISIAMIIIGVITLAFAKNYLMKFLAILVINTSILLLIYESHIGDLLTIYNSCLAIIITYFYLKEAYFITDKRFGEKLYSPLRLAIVLAIFINLTIITFQSLTLIHTQFYWIFSIVNIVLILFTLNKIFDKIKLDNTFYKIFLFIFSTILLGLTALSPGISAGILIILLSFYSNYRSTFVIGIIAFIYFLGQFYYDLSYTLLTKSILLMTSGVLFLILYSITHKNSSKDEKI